MRKYILILCITIITLLIVFVPKEKNQEYLRIHIRANSNLSVDQNIKYQIKDAVVEALVPYLANCQTKEQSINVVTDNFPLIENIANSLLAENNFSYTAKAKLANEKFPTRSYGDLTLEEGFYDALILELGEAKGDNWWCVVYPPFCFINSGTNSIIYKSRLYEIINNFINK